MMDGPRADPEQNIAGQTGNDGLNLAALYIAAYMQEKDHQDFYFKMCGVSGGASGWSREIARHVLKDCRFSHTG